MKLSYIVVLAAIVLLMAMLNPKHVKAQTTISYNMNKLILIQNYVK